MDKQFGYDYINESELHSAAIIDVNGLPYLLGEYLDKNTFQMINRSNIRSEVIIDKTEHMMPAFNISIDDIGRASDGCPSVIGNATKWKYMLKTLSDYSSLYGNELGVLKPELVVRVNYQIENHRTGHVIKTMTEDFRIRERNYFIDINPNDINDNAIITNFHTCTMSSIGQFTHGMDRMQFRITNIQLYYELVRARKDGIGPFKMCNRHEPPKMDHCMEMTHRYVNNNLIPEQWATYNHFYHYDRETADIRLHTQEINDHRYEVIPIPIGKIGINRAITVNPGSRIVFRFNIWRNDLVVVSSGYEVAKALKVPYIDEAYDGCDKPDGDEVPNINLDYENTIRMVYDLQCAVEKQNAVILNLSQTINELNEAVKLLMPTPPSGDAEDNDNGNSSDSDNDDSSGDTEEPSVDDNIDSSEGNDNNDDVETPPVEDDEPSEIPDDDNIEEPNE